MTTKFDWHSEVIDCETVIDENYKNTQNVRRFFAQEIDEEFRFNRSFMVWLKVNSGKTMGEAIAEFIHRKSSN